MAAAHRLRVYNYILLTLDSEIHGVLARLHAPSFLPPDPAWAASQEPVYRWKLVTEALHRGISVVYCDPAAVLLRNPFETFAKTHAHIIAGDLRPPDETATSPRGAKSGHEPGRIDVGFIFLRASNHMLNLMPKVIAAIVPNSKGSPTEAFNHVLNGGPGGFVTWNTAALRDPHLHSDQRVVDGYTSSGLRLVLWSDTIVRKFGCGLRNPLKGVTVLNCVFSSFTFGHALEGATESQVTEAGLRAMGAWFLVPNWAGIKPQATLQQWLAIAQASDTQIRLGIACRAGQGERC